MIMLPLLVCNRLLEQARASRYYSIHCWTIENRILSYYKHLWQLTALLEKIQTASFHGRQILLFSGRYDNDNNNREFRCID
jgi:hypothetical protein